MDKEITIGSKIKVELNGNVKNLEIVGSADVDANCGRISYLSPIGSALLGRQIGEILKVKLATGKIIKCKIIEIN